MSKMVSHDPFGYLKHKLWPKKGLGDTFPIPLGIQMWVPNKKTAKKQGVEARSLVRNTL